MEYKVLTAREIQQLEDIVRAAIARGWEPIGGVAIQKMREPRTEQDQCTVLFAQAVVLKAQRSR